MSFKDVLSIVGIFVLMGLLFFYWFFPLSEIEFGSFSSGNSNFTTDNSSEKGMQFYSNMRYSESEISYRIEGCTLQKTDDMKGAFSRIGNLTILDFYPVESNEEILVTCDSKTKFDGDFFIAGEGGPTNITQAGEFNVIRNGGIVLIRESKCENPNVAIHELLHALGFDHSTNSENIMYEVSQCDQEIGQDIINFINEIYSIPSLPDLAFENASASMQGKYLDLEMTVRNLGLRSSENATVSIYADDKKIKEIETEAMPIGSGRRVNFENILVLQTNVRQIKLSIDYDLEELKKDNNVIRLEIKNN